MQKLNFASLSREEQLALRNQRGPAAKKESNPLKDANLPKNEPSKKKKLGDFMRSGELKKKKIAHEDATTTQTTTTTTTAPPPPAMCDVSTSITPHQSPQFMRGCSTEASTSMTPLDKTSSTITPVPSPSVSTLIGDIHFEGDPLTARDDLQGVTVEESEVVRQLLEDSVADRNLISKLKSEFEDVKLQRKDFESSAVQLSLSLKCTQVELSHVSAELAIAQERVATTTALNKELREKLSTLSHTNRELQSTVDRLKKHTGELKFAASVDSIRAEKRISDVQGQVQMVEEAASAKERVYQQEISQWEELLTSSAATHQAQVESAVAKIRRLEQEKRALVEELESLRGVADGSK